VKIPGVFLRRLVVRGVAIWLLARISALLAIAVMQSMMGHSAMMDDVTIHPGATVAVAAALVLVDLKRRKELMLLSNLGVMTSSAVLIGTIPALLLEAAYVTFIA
jgi:hypothetical protein